MQHRQCLYLVILLIAVGCYGSSSTPPQSKNYSRTDMVAAAKMIADGPTYASSKSGGGGDTAPFYQEWHFLVSKGDFETSVGKKIEGNRSLLWEVFQNYRAFLDSHVDVKKIPDIISLGGASKFDPNSLRDEYHCESKDFSFGFFAEWFRGGPKDEGGDSEEVLVSVRIRVN